jgi:hypothetical protein
VWVELRTAPYYATIDTMYADEHRLAVRRELRRHARRVAYLSRMRQLAEELGDYELIARVDELFGREQRRYERRMYRLGRPVT